MKLLTKLALFVLILSACAPVSLPNPGPSLISDGDGRQDSAFHLTWSPDDKLLAVATFTGLYIYDTKTYKQQAAFPEARGATVIFGKKYVVANTGSDLYVWDLDNYKLVSEHHTKESVIFLSFAVSPDDQLLVAGEGKQIRIWSLTDGKAIANIPNEGFPWDMAFANRGTIIVADVFWGGIQEWDIETQKKTGGFQIERPVISFNLSNEGQIAIVDYGDYGFEIWNTATGKLKHTYNDIIGASGSNNLSGDYQKVVVWGYGDGQSSLSVWDLITGKQVHEFSTPLVNGDGWRCGALNSDGSVLAASNNAGYIYFYDLKSGEKISEIFIPYKFMD